MGGNYLRSVRLVTFVTDFGKAPKRGHRLNGYGWPKIAKYVVNKPD